MTGFVLGGLTGVAARERPDLLAAPTLEALTALGLLESVGVVEIDPAISETAATQDAYGLEAHQLVNCVLVGGRRDGEERVAAALVPASKRADVNGFVRRRLDVRKASFLPHDQAVETSGMEYGGITPIGLPAGWPLLLDADTAAEPLVVIGSGVRRSKILAPGAVLAALPGAEASPDLARAV
ncbi:YbaK/EbsC family protein [Amnibacterium kyonggiense]|uniref:Prolyl-tRNA editing enzyme YbaK/EbsC (Cys-tRNA(Pro) deacylase) n=1 Tax=Amnibacterium kyonggiense TaxID=595671 RepID=A0A4R7FL45_9MICO|nr:YbaK/EbsC family protein [Amnibacterium kyonggiense]TDS77121.1 prolyl-tRNA editing enzyme YbaK/EbsC (Cys-tRNA(Pro) deacylase) [Amnibacterium kyonggiense]